MILDKGFSFSQKLVIFKALDIAKCEVVDSLVALNRLRNKCAHDMEYRISEVDIDRIGLPYGKDYFEDKEKYSAEKDKKQLLYLSLIGIIAPLDGLIRHIKRDHKGIGKVHGHSKSPKNMKRNKN